MRIKLVALLLAASAGTPALIAPAQAQNFREGGIASPNLAREEVAMVQRGERRANRQGNRANRAERRGNRASRQGNRANRQGNRANRQGIAPIAPNDAAIRQTVRAIARTARVIAHSSAPIATIAVKRKSTASSGVRLNGA